MEMSGRIALGFVQMAAILLLAACGNGADLGNLRPEANAGIDQSVRAGGEVELDGSKSRDLDGAIESYLWEQVGEGESVQLTGADKSKASFTAPRKEGVLIFRLTVTDNDGASASDDVRIQVKPAQATDASGLDNRPLNRTCVAPPKPSGSGSGEIEIERAFPQLDFTQPLAMLQAPDNDGRWYVVERGGTVRTFTGGESSTRVFADISDRVLAPDPIWSEQGLLGMAFPPDFASKRQVYLSYNRKPDGTSVISRFTVRSDGLSVDIGSEQVILTVEQPNANHNGGGIAFGPDGYLYIGFGDGGGAGDEENNAQNTHNLLGAMLRIDVSRSAGGKPYAIPADNPFASSSGCGDGAGCPEIWAWGLRNPWRWSFDRATGKLWAGDVGQDAWEEVDIVEGGKNYGWRCYEGSHEYNTAGCGARDQYTFPVVEYGHDEGRSITGGYVYRGNAIPGLRGTYLYADYVEGKVWGFSVEGGETELLASSGLSIASFAEGNDGELYLLNYDGGTIYKIVPKGGSTAPVDGGFPQKLSETGCFKADDPTQPVEGLIPYGVNAPLWSDGAEKHRWFAIPDGTTIEIDADGNNWIFPPGSVLIKEFRLGGKRVETRLLVRHDDGEWMGYSYEWDDQESDATLLSGGKSKSVAGQVWGYPSQKQCMFCHTGAAGFVLGPETLQLNGLFTYPRTGKTANQLATYEQIGLFPSSLPDRPDNLPALIDFMDPAAPFDKRARAYLHANCSSCHRPGATELADFRYQISLREMGICNAQPVHGDTGTGSEGRLLVPGSPDNSVLLVRMQSVAPGRRMPMLGTRVMDPVGIEVVSRWIESLSGCGNPS
ncbi:MAG TPA: hypothetical protein ENJ43_01515 [Gammaproteobacteria bacterium]|nr:hypothetical protein [Gammaproteobacteria bacterium]